MPKDWTRESRGRADARTILLSAARRPALRFDAHPRDVEPVMPMAAGPVVVGDAPLRPQAAHHGRAHRSLDRLRGRPARAGGGRRGRPDRLRPGAAHHPAHGQAAAHRGRRARARRQRPRAARGRRGRARGSLGALDGVLHAIAYVPPDALGGRFLETPMASATAAFEVSAFSLKGLAAALADLLEKGDAGGVVGLDFDAAVAWPAYDWAGVSKAALESVSRYLARDLGRAACARTSSPPGPLQTVAASNIDGFEGLSGSASARPRWAGTRPTPARSPTPACSCSRRGRGRSPGSPARRRRRARRGAAPRRLVGVDLSHHAVCAAVTWVALLGCGCGGGPTAGGDRGGGRRGGPARSRPAEPRTTAWPRRTRR